MIAFILLLGAFLRLVSINQSFWLDETIQAVTSSRPISRIDLGGDFQPPLSYILSHFWQSIGIKSEWFLRLPNVVLGVVSVYLIYYLTKKLFNHRAGLSAGLLLSTAPFHIYYSQEYRMYSLLTFLILLSWIFLWQKRWILYGITILAAFFTHYFAFFAILSQFIYIIFYERKNAKQFIIHTSLFIIPALAWLPTLKKQFETARTLISLWPKWGEVLGVSFIKFIPLVLAKFTVGVTSPPKIIYIPAVIIVITVFLIATVKLFRFRTSGQHSTPPGWRLSSLGSKETLLFIYFFIPLIIAWILGLWVSANTPHRLLFVLPAFYAILAAGLIKIKNKNLKIALIAIVLISNISFSGYYLLNPKNHRENWADSIDFTDKRVGDSGVVLAEFNAPFAPMEWYSKKLDRYQGASTTFKITDQSVKNKLDPLFNSTSQKRITGNVILYTYLYEISDPERKVQRYLLSKNFKIKEEKDFKGVGIIKIFSR